MLFYLCRSDLLDHGGRLDSFIVLFLQLSTNLMQDDLLRVEPLEVDESLDKVEEGRGNDKDSAG